MSNESKITKATIKCKCGKRFQSLKAFQKHVGKDCRFQVRETADQIRAEVSADLARLAKWNAGKPRKAGDDVKVRDDL